MLAAGQTVDVEFDLDRTGHDNSPVDVAMPASITVLLPDDARLFVAGTEMQSTGSVRKFATTRLNPGQKWEEFTIRAEIVRDGEISWMHKTVTLGTGESRQVHFDFDGERVARLPSDDAVEE